MSLCVYIQKERWYSGSCNLLFFRLLKKKVDIKKNSVFFFFSFFFFFFWIINQTWSMSTAGQVKYNDRINTIPSHFLLKVIKCRAAVAWEAGKPLSNLFFFFPETCQTKKKKYRHWRSWSSSTKGSWSSYQDPLHWCVSRSDSSLWTLTDWFYIKLSYRRIHSFWCW